MATYDSLPVVPVGKNGASMPLIGFGTCCRKSSTGPLLIRSTLDFLAAGGRLIDTAEMYGNHKDLKRAILQSGVPRSELWITSKVNTKRVFTRAGAKRAVATSIRELGVSRLDLMLLHGAFKQTSAQREAVWRGLIGAKAEGLVREIGVSNYDRGQIEQLVAATAVTPAVVQLECNPWVANATHEYVQWLQGQGIAVTAYASLRPRGQQAVGGWGGVSQVAKRHGVTSSQVLLRWAIDRRVAVIPGATSKGHIVENLKLEGLHLTPEDLELIARDATALFGVSAQLPVGFGTGGGSPPLPVPPHSHSAAGDKEPFLQARPCARGINQKTHPGEVVNSSMEHANTFHFAGAFLRQHWASFTTHGYFALRSAVAPASLRALTARYLPLGYEQRSRGFALVRQDGCKQQPRRLKIKITNSSMDFKSGVFSGVSDEFAKILRDTQAVVKTFNAVYFIAYCILMLPTRGKRSKRAGTVSALPAVMDPAVNYRELLAKVAEWKIHMNAAFPGAVFQNPHYDIRSTDTQKQPLFIDIPLANVESRSGAPLEVWPGTNNAVYGEVLTHPKPWLAAAPCSRQYFNCFPEVQALAQLWPSTLRFSTIGEATVRNPAMWHRGTPNDLGIVRDQFLFMFTRL